MKVRMVWYGMVWYGMVIGGLVITSFTGFTNKAQAGDATLTLDDNAGSSSFVVQDVDKTNQFRVNSDGQGYFAGNVGIGTTNPDRGALTGSPNTAVLNVDSTVPLIRQSVSGAAGSFWQTSGSVGFGSELGSNKNVIFYTNQSEVLTLTTGGNVGIGTTAPGTKLQVSGNVSANNVDGISFKSTGETNNNGGAFSVFRSNGARVWMVGNDGSIWGFNSDGSSYRYGIRGDGGDTFFNSSGGNVGIGTQAPTEKLEVSGNIKASGTVSQGSSREFKKNISYVSTKDAVNALNKLNPVRFEYKTDSSGEKHLGFIAEDVPDLVAEQDRKHLNSMDITAVLTKVVQEQQREIQEQQRTISVLKTEMEEMKRRF